jgi:membrane-associated phospholipid phosphatase
LILLLHALWTPITIVLFVLLARPWSNPLQRVAGAVLALAHTRGGRRTLVAAALVMTANLLDCLVEPALARWLGYDLTAWVRSVEGDLVERVQATLPAAFAAPLAWFYLSGFVAAVLAPAIVWADEGRFHAVRALVIGCLANYAFGLFFYVFVPVREAAWSGLSNARPLLDAVYPGLSAELRLGSALDNCLPSLHVSLTVTSFAVVLARRAPRDRTLLILSGAAALLTAYAVMALGVHWALDVAAGAAFGLACAWLGLARAPRDDA